MTPQIKGTEKTEHRRTSDRSHEDGRKIGPELPAGRAGRQNQYLALRGRSQYPHHPQEAEGDAALFGLYSEILGKNMAHTQTCLLYLGATRRLKMDLFKISHLIKKTHRKN
jgi:hypothetical protein